MKATGIVRRIDDLGRVVIPKEIRRTLRIREGDPLEIFVDRDGEVILKKYSALEELSDFAQEYADSLHESTGHIALVTDRDVVVAVAGTGKKDWIGKPVPPVIEHACTTRRSLLLPGVGTEKLPEAWPFRSQAIAPIVSEGDPVGSVALASDQQGVVMGDLERKLVETAAAFLGKQMEQ
ncbi:stage V sporulation protein T [Limnochorda pilosa]|uniref:Stage V sporulation protein T n=1 Tax=Limnochorda pilosa TaxID=1555112 RepID=A0A0K2SQJ3_LIMPI|nr:stage V sporulation protein T [Limnochorda pilosa]BAS29403.1 stage V sporulation protein T [Limnochorda pilosa]